MGGGETLAQLTRTFDASFTLPPPTPETKEDLLAVRIGGEPFALRVSEVGGIHARRSIAWLPNGPTGLLGVAGLRGQVVAVYSLSSLLGYAVEAGAPRWMVVCGAQGDLAVAFETFEGHLQVSPERLCPVVSGERHMHVSHLLEAKDEASQVRSVLTVPSLIACCRRRAGLKEEV